MINTVEAPNNQIVPDVGGRHQPEQWLNNTVVIARAERSLFPSSGSINFQNDFEHIDDLHLRFGIRGDQRLAHDPVKDRARYERAKNDWERQAVRAGVIADMEKHLYERAKTSQSTVTYYQDNEGRIYNPKFPGESFDITLQRGLEDSRRNGFVDHEREVAEFAGWKEVMTKLFAPQTPIGSKEIVISGPGLKKNTAFTDNFVDIFTKAIDHTTGKVVVVMTRFASGVSYDEYSKIATSLDNNYFNLKQQEKGKEDIFYKAHPIFIDSRLDSRSDEQFFNEEFAKQNQATAEGKTKGYLDECRLFILHYAETICSSFFDPENVKIAFNATINKFDAVRKGILRFGKDIIEKISGFGSYIKDQIDYYGRMKVEEIMVGCGLSAGFSIESILGTIGGLILNTVGRIFSLFSGKDQYGSLEFPCPKCRMINRRPYGQLIPNCQQCRADVKC